MGGQPTPGARNKGNTQVTRTVLTTHVPTESLADTRVERREFGRRKTKKAARVVWVDGAISGFVTDISLGGARVQLDGADRVPKQFDLQILEEDISVGCEIVHFGFDYIGAKFTRLPRRISGSPVSNLVRLHLRKLLGGVE